ncbi:hypothetical protein EVAR_58937_1 [Eumeta japonica]|uniref:Uncharacterized protein n=1 Tax=Eumeta variegata TaxID=151549 RepID=A0A4C1YA24_EUMVA|nr:hypothetical protein EVAR_58937_1 [Eumeta japonica]
MYLLSKQSVLRPFTAWTVESFAEKNAMASIGDRAILSTGPVTGAKRSSRPAGYEVVGRAALPARPAAARRLRASPVNHLSLSITAFRKN